MCYILVNGKFFFFIVFDIFILFFCHFYKEGKAVSKRAGISSVGPNRREKFKRYKGRVWGYEKSTQKREWAYLSFLCKHGGSPRRKGSMQRLWKRKVISAAEWAEEG